jgi:hypothetical protein
MLAGVRWALSFFLLVTLHVRALDETTGDEELAIDDAVMGEEYGLGDELKALADELGDGGTTDEGGGGADESEGLDDLKDYDPEERGFHDLEDYDSEEMMLYYGTDDDFYIPEDSADLRQFDSSELFTVQLAPKQSSCFYIDVEEASTLDVTGAYLVVENIPIEVKVFQQNVYHGGCWGRREGGGGAESVRDSDVPNVSHAGKPTFHGLGLYGTREKGGKGAI